MSEPEPGIVVFDFADDDARTSVERWTPVGDPVMGGRSESRFALGDGFAAFEGFVSFDRGGGFASVRADTPALDLSASRGIELRLRGDGKRYKLNLRDRPGFDPVLHAAGFVAPPSRWTDVRIPFDALVPSRRGRPVDAPPLARDRVTGFGLMISDRQEGPFRLEIARISAYA